MRGLVLLAYALAGWLLCGFVLVPVEARIPTWLAALAPPYEIADITYVEGLGPQRPSVGFGDCETAAVAEYHRLRAAGREAYVLLGRLADGTWHAAAWDGRYHDPLGQVDAGFRPVFAFDEHRAYRVQE